MSQEWITAFAEIIEDYCHWLSAIGDQGYRLAKWKADLASPHHEEAAICEATTWDYLRRSGLQIDSGENPSTGGPDFRCSKGSHSFYVEATCLTIATATKYSGISTEPGFGTWGFLTTAIWNECKDKARQLAGLDAPALLAISTLHGFAAMTCFDKLGVANLLTGETKMSWTLDPASGQMSPVRNVTEFKSSVFLAPDSAAPYLEHKRTPISGVLLCSSGMPGRQTFGALHPHPNRPFNPVWMKDVAFCRLREGYVQSGELQVEWLNGQE